VRRWRQGSYIDCDACDTAAGQITRRSGESASRSISNRSSGQASWYEAGGNAGQVELNKGKRADTRIADDANRSSAQSNRPGGVNGMCADGSVRFIKDSINVQTWMALGTKSNGEVITSDSF
jgi:Protein of unknown function (DUF1559)